MRASRTAQRAADRNPAGPPNMQTIELSPHQQHSYFQQELPHFPNDQRFVHYEYVVVGVMQFDDS